MKRHFLSKRDSKEFIDLLDKYGIPADAKTVELEENDINIIYLDKIPVLVKFQDKWLPTLRVMLANSFPSVVIDDGAVQRIKNGAKLYAVGISKINGQIKKGFPVILQDLRGKNIGSALPESDENEIVEKKKGAYLIVYELYS